jgi:zinc D-Ala-D-Ala carboxypeptidase
MACRGRYFPARPKEIRGIVGSAIGRTLTGIALIAGATAGCATLPRAVGSAGHAPTAQSTPAASSENSASSAYEAYEATLGEGPNPGGFTSAMQRRVAQAIAAARAAGLDMVINSGWRSPQEQQSLLNEAIKKYGSRAAAVQWVLPPEDSEHVRGLAVDIGPAPAASWLEAHGAAFGLCRRYENESWHFEPLIPPGGKCPALEPHAVPS